MVVHVIFSQSFDKTGGVAVADDVGGDVNQRVL